MKLEKQTKHVTLIDEIDLTGSLDEMIDYLNNLKEQYKDNYVSLRIDKEYDYDYVSFSLIGQRWETSAEYERRLKAEETKRKKLEALRAKKEEKDRKEYERLRKKYEKMEDASL